MDVAGMEHVLNNEAEIDQRIYVFPTSAILENGKKISYFDYISSLKNEDCNRALKRIERRINMGDINRLIDEIPAVTEIQKDFYKVMISERKTKILDYSLEQLLKQEWCCDGEKTKEILIMFSNHLIEYAEERYEERLELLGRCV